MRGEKGRLEIEEGMEESGEGGVSGGSESGREDV